MGCNSSKDVMVRIKKQEAKIDALTNLNQELEHKLSELHSNTASENKPVNETNDITHLKTTIDMRFSKLEKTVEKIHNELKMKLFEGLGDNPEDRNGNRRGGDDSLSLNFEKENVMKVSDRHRKNDETPWKDLLNDSNLMAHKMMTMERPVRERAVYEDNMQNGYGNMMKYLENRERATLNSLKTDNNPRGDGSLTAKGGKQR